MRSAYLNGLACSLPLIVFLSSCSNTAENPSGRWAATLVSQGVTVPFRLDIQTQGADAKGLFFDGERRIPSDSGSWNGGRVRLHFDTYNADLDLEVKHGQLSGEYIVHRAKKDYARAVSASRYVAESASATGTASLAGDWELRNATPPAKKDDEVAWKLVVRQDGDQLNGAILRLDGDTGSLAGTIHDGKIVLSHFSGARPTVVKGELKADGTLDLTVDGDLKVIGVREADAQRRGLAPEPDAFHSTTVKDAAKPFTFSAPDASGRTYSTGDFRGKVLIVSIGGTWCPNCMDEAPFLVDLYRKYHARGLDIVGLNFESGVTEYDRKRVQSFVARYGIPYPVLIAGTTDNAGKALSDLVNFSAYPTTIFIGRDGLVKGIHDGFASVATGAAHQQLSAETDAIVERLLSAKSKARIMTLPAVLVRRRRLT